MERIGNQEEGFPMAMTVTEECINCGVCEPECPREAIHEGDMVYEIDAETCTECEEEGESQCAAICPIHCIVRLE
jgi:ferredoxin